jgi:hypothetical protein
MVVDDRGCPRCWWKTPVPKLRKRIKMTSANMGGGPPPPQPTTYALRGTNTFYDPFQATQQLTISNVTVGAGSSIYVTMGFVGSQQAEVSTIVWGSVTATFAANARRDEYDDNSYTFSSQWLLPRPGAGTHNLVINLDPVNTAPTAFIAAAFEIRPGPSVGDPIDEPAAGAINSEVSHCVATTFLELYGPAGTPFPYTTTSAPGGFRPLSYSPDLGIVCLVTAGPTTDTPGTWSSQITPITRFGTSIGSNSTDCTMMIGTMTLTQPTIPQAQKIANTGFTNRGAVITLDTFRP